MSGGAGDIAKVAVPMALTVASGGLAAPALLSAVPALGAVGAGAISGAAAGALGSAITGGDPLTGAALGGIGGGFTGGLSGGAEAAAAGTDAAASAATEAAAAGVTDSASAIGSSEGLSSLYGVTDPSALAASQPQGLGALAPAPAEIGSYTGSAPLDSTFNVANSGGVPNAAAFAPGSQIDAAAQSGIGFTPSLAENAAPGALDKMINYAANNPMSVAGAGLGGYLMGGEEETQEPLARDERKINKVAPLQRQQTQIDPNAFQGIGGARSGYVRANPATVYLADGGSARDKSDSQMRREEAMDLYARSMARDPKFNGRDIDEYLNKLDGGYTGTIDDYIGNIARTRKYAHGGSAHPRGLGSMVNGKGDGQSDEIPAMLSDGEYVIPAPVVSALGRGSNDAGAKKLDKMKAGVMKKTYKGGKPPAAGLGSMRVA